MALVTAREQVLVASPVCLLVSVVSFAKQGCGMPSLMPRLTGLRVTRGGRLCGTRRGPQLICGGNYSACVWVPCVCLHVGIPEAEVLPQIYLESMGLVGSQVQMQPHNPLRFEGFLCLSPAT